MQRSRLLKVLILVLPALMAMRMGGLLKVAMYTHDHGHGEGPPRAAGLDPWAVGNQRDILTAATADFKRSVLSEVTESIRSAVSTMVVGTLPGVLAPLIEKLGGSLQVRFAYIERRAAVIDQRLDTHQVVHAQLQER